MIGAARGVAAVALVLAGCDRCASEPAPTSAPRSPPGFASEPAVGEIDHDGFVVWARGTAPGELVVRVDAIERRAAIDEEHDLTARVVIEGLSPGDHAWRAAIGDQAREGRVRLAPPPDVSAPVSFAWTGDVGGQNVCRDVELGFLLLGVIDVSRFDFTIALGDWIYADDVCEARGRYGNRQVPGEFGPADDLASFRAHWRYAEEDPGYARFRARTYVVWDDHEVYGDFGRVEPRYAAGRRAFVEHSPLAVAPEDVRAPLWRSARWGRHLELLLLDTRSFRDDKRDADEPAAPKTMLGSEQRAWLEARLRESDATHVVIASSVPVGIPTGWPPEEGSDGWADREGTTGFEEELIPLLRAAQRVGRRRLTFITTDVHFASAIRYRPFDDAPEFEVLEIVTGPASAGLFPSLELDPTLRPERLFFHGPDGLDAVQTLDEARPWSSWGTIAIDERGTMRVAIRGEREALWSLELSAR